MADLVIYHGGCPDGIAAAWCFWRTVLKGDATKLYYGQFNEPHPDVTDKHVVFVDFTYSAETIESMLKTAASITVLDHHKSATPLEKIKNDKFKLTLDMNRSGAQIAWDYTHPEQQRPWFINDIGDRDLWTWKIPDSKESTIAMGSLGYYANINQFDKIQHCMREMFVLVGKSISIANDNTMNRIIKGAALAETTFLNPNTNAPYRVKLVSCSDSTFVSEIGNKLVFDKSCDFAIIYRYDLTKDEWYLSARADSTTDIDLTTILPMINKKSGGHAKAAGATINGGASLKTYFNVVKVMA
jgi:oligoribonuclease NrnB/cAMP/cGMP phosphodiesterase (DHH superfamily)